MSSRKKISELKVKELKLELGMRNIEKSGNKVELISKLKNALDSSYLSEDTEEQIAVQSSNGMCKTKRAKQNYINSYQSKIDCLENKIVGLRSIIKRLIK